MINPNETVSEEVLQQYKQASYERFRVQFASAVEQKLIDFDMSYDELAKQLSWLWNEYQSSRILTGEEIKKEIRGDGYGFLDLERMNEIAHVFSCEIYAIFRPRLPWINS